MNKKNKGIGTKVAAIALTSFITIGSFSNTSFATNGMVPLDTSVVKYNTTSKDNKDSKDNDIDKNGNSDKQSNTTNNKENNSCIVVTTERTNEIINSIRSRKEKSLDTKLINDFNEYLDNLVSYVNLSIKYKIEGNTAKSNELAKLFNEIYSKKDELQVEDINKFMKTEIPVLNINSTGAVDTEHARDGQPGSVIADKQEEDKKDSSTQIGDTKVNAAKTILEKAKELQKKLDSKDKDFKEHYNLEINEFNRSIRYLAYWSTSTNEAAKDKLPEAIDIVNSWSAFFGDLLKSGENPIKDTEKTPGDKSKNGTVVPSTPSAPNKADTPNKADASTQTADASVDTNVKDTKDTTKQVADKDNKNKVVETQTTESSTGSVQTSKDNGKKGENKSLTKPVVTIEKKAPTDGNKTSATTTPKATTENKSSGASSSSSTSSPSTSSSTSSPSTSSTSSSSSSSTSGEATTPDDGKRNVKVDVGENGLTFYVFDVTSMNGDSTKTGKELENEILEKAKKENWGEKEPLYKLETKTVDGKDGILEFEGDAGKIYYVYPSSANSTKVDDLVIALPALEKSENGSGKGASSTTANGKDTTATPDNGKGTANAPQTNDPNIIGKIAGGLAAGGAIASGAYLYTKRNKKDNDIIPDGLDIK